MRGVVIAAAALGLLGAALGVAAQTEGKFLVVAAASHARPFDADVAPKLFPGGFIARVPKPGFHAAGGLNWFSTDLREAGGGRRIGHLRVRPVMAGASYIIVRGRLAVTTSLVGGYAFNSVEDKPAIEGVAHFEAKNSFAARPALSVIWSLDRRWVLFLGAGVLFVDPDIRLISVDPGHGDRTPSGTWRMNSLVWGVGIGRSFF